MKKNANHEILFETNTIVVTKKFMKEARVMGTPEFDEYMSLREKFPGFTFTEREIKKNPEKVSYRNLTYANMESTITEIFKNDKEKQQDKLAEYKSMKIISQIQPAPYSYMKSWFLETYGETYHKKYNVNTESNAKNQKQVQNETTEAA